MQTVNYQQLSMGKYGNYFIEKSLFCQYVEFFRLYSSNFTTKLMGTIFLKKCLPIKHRKANILTFFKTGKGFFTTLFCPLSNERKFVVIMRVQDIQPVKYHNSIAYRAGSSVRSPVVLN